MHLLSLPPVASCPQLYPFIQKLRFFYPSFAIAGMAMFLFRFCHRRRRSFHDECVSEFLTLPGRLVTPASSGITGTGNGGISGRGAHAQFRAQQPLSPRAAALLSANALVPNWLEPEIAAAAKLATASAASAASPSSASPSNHAALALRKAPVLMRRPTMNAIPRSPQGPAAMGSNKNGSFSQSLAVAAGLRPTLKRGSTLFAGDMDAVLNQQSATNGMVGSASGSSLHGSGSGSGLGSGPALTTRRSARPSFLHLATLGALDPRVFVLSRAGQVVLTAAAAAAAGAPMSTPTSSSISGGADGSNTGSGTGTGTGTSTSGAGAGKPGRSMTHARMTVARAAQEAELEAAAEAQAFEFFTDAAAEEAEAAAAAAAAAKAAADAAARLALIDSTPHASGPYGAAMLLAGAPVTAATAAHAANGSTTGRGPGGGGARRGSMLLRMSTIAPAAGVGVGAGAALKPSTGATAASSAGSAGSSTAAVPPPLPQMPPMPPMPMMPALGQSRSRPSLTLVLPSDDASAPPSVTPSPAVAPALAADGGHEGNHTTISGDGALAGLFIGEAATAHAQPRRRHARSQSHGSARFAVPLTPDVDIDIGATNDGSGAGASTAGPPPSLARRKTIVFATPAQRVAADAESDR